MKKCKHLPSQIPAKKININFSSSDSSFSDDIPYLSPSQSQQTSGLLIDVNDDDSDFDEELPVISKTHLESDTSNSIESPEIQWTSPKHQSKHKKKKPNPIRNQDNTNEVTHSNRPKKRSINHESSKQDSKANHKQNIVISQDIDTSIIENQIHHPVEMSNESNNQNNSEINLEAYRQFSSSINETIEQSNYIQQRLTLNEVVHYQIERIINGYGSHFDLVMKSDKNHRIIYQTQRKNRKKILIVTSPSKPKAYLKHNFSNDSFVLHIFDTKSEICGIYFVPETKPMSTGVVNKQKRMYLIIPKVIPYIPTSESNSIASIIANNQENIPDNFIQLHSMPPEIVDGEIVSVLGKESVRSIKNYVVYDQNNLIAFEHYKITDNFFRLHFGGVVTPIMAFAICVSIFWQNFRF